MRNIPHKLLVLYRTRWLPTNAILQVRMKKYLRQVIGPVILLATIVVFGYYISRHPQTLEQLHRLPLSVVVLLLVLCSLSFVVYVLITRVSLRMYHKTMSLQENFLFNAYSSLINFFGPGQSGPIFRAAYLKRRHNLAVKQFTFTLVLYLAFLAIISAMCMFIGSRPAWQTLLLMLAVGGVSIFVVRLYKRRSNIEMGSGLNPLTIGLLFGAVALQVALLAVLYGAELHQVGAHASWGEVLSYTGVSNFSIFVALTPGAIGIREAFLVFSQNLHHIDTSQIVAANIIDRGVYLLFLGLVFLLVLGTHAKDKLGVSKTPSS